MPFIIIILALGTFAIGTDEYLVAGLLPTVASAMHVSEGVAGQLATVFAIMYALGSPVLAIATAHMERKRLLVGTILFFALANLAAVFVPSATWLFGTRIIAGLAAGLYMPMAMATATQMVDRGKQGSAIAAIMAGVTGALVLGLPLGSWVGTLFGWRTSFAAVAIIGGIVTLLLLVLLPRMETGNDVITWRDRVGLLTKKHAVIALCITFVALLGANNILIYILPLLHRLTTFGPGMISVVLFGSGLASVMGNILGGILVDRWGVRRVLLAVFTFMILNAALFSFLMLFQNSLPLNIVVFIAFFIWGLGGWLGAPALNTYLVSLEPQSATVALSLNMTALYLGIATAGLVGGLVLSLSGVAYLGIASALIEAISLVLVLANVRSIVSIGQPEQEMPATPALRGNSEVRN